MTRLTRLLLALALLTAAACENPNDSGQRAPARLVVVSGDLQSDTVGKEVAQPLVVRVVDDRDRPVRNQLVNFVVTTGGGAVFAGSAVTNADGEARERWTLGTVAGDTQRVEARAVDASTGQAIVFGTFRAVGVPDAPAAASAVGATSRAGAAGTAVADSLAIRVVDKHGNGVPGVAVAFGTANGGGVSPATATTRADGTARAQWTLGPATGQQTATATAAGLPAITFTAATGPGAVTRVVLAPEAISFSALGQTQALTVQAFDAFGNMVGGQQATIISQNAAVVALDNGAIARATGNGTANLIATVQGSAAADTTVVMVQQTATRVELDFSTKTLQPGDTYQLAPRAYDGPYPTGQRIHNAVFTYSSNTPAVTVSATGLVTAVSGTSGAVITVSHDGVSTTTTIVVEDYLVASTISMGAASACGLDISGRAYCWGADHAVPAGATQTDACRDGRPCYFKAVPVGGGVRFSQIVTQGTGTCALSTSGAAYCVGAGDVLAPVPGNQVFASLSTGYSPRCALTAAGEAWCGLSATTAPVRAAVGFTFTTLTAGLAHVCGLTANGSAYCWGKNSGGELGDGTTIDRTDPVPVAGGLRFASISAGTGFFGAAHTCGVTAAGAGYCWGANNFGQLGDGSATSGSTTPVQVAGGHTWRMISTGTSRTCGVTTGNAAYCWGNLVVTRGGIGPSTNTPTAVAGDGAYTVVDAGEGSSCAIDTAGRARCWGLNTSGELGNGTFTDTQTPVYVRVRS
jgi:hypothetical protein